MDFSLTREQKAFRDSVHEFAIREVRPVETALDKLADPGDVAKSDEFWRVLKKGYELGFHKLLIPKNAGGLGVGDPIYWVIMVEELAYGGGGFASTFLVAPMGFLFMAMFGADRYPDLRDNYLKPFVENDDPHFMGAWAVTEPDCGSDIFERRVKGLKFRTTARLDGDHYIIAGSKAAWVSNGSLAKLYLTHVCVAPDKGMEGTGIFLIPRDLKGVSVGKPLDKMGLRVLNQAEVYFDDVRVPKNYCLFEPSPLYHNVLETMATAGNIIVATLAVGVARAAYEEALAYAKQRVQGGKPIIAHPNVGLKLFDAYTRITASRNLIYFAVCSGFTGQAENLKYAAACRLLATETCTKVTEEMIQVMGGVGISREYNLEKYMRDAKMLKIMDGTVDRIALNAVPLL